MAFRYINPGNGVGIIPETSRLVVENSQYSKTGTAFSSTADSDAYYLVTLPNYIGADLWIRLDLYIDSTSSASKFYLGYWASESTYSNKNFAWMEGLYLLSGILRVNMSTNYDSTKAKYTLQKQAVNQICCHLHNEIGTDKSYAELNVNGNITSQTKTRSSSYYAIGTETDVMKTMVIQFPSSYPCYVSNLIISDKETSIKERTAALPISSTFIDMTAGASGIYFADAAGQTLLQTVDVSQLIENFGASSAVTGIATVGNPAYRSATGITTLTSLSEQNSVVTEYNSYNLSEDTTATILDGWGLSGTTITDLQNMRFGWKAGE